MEAPGTSISYTKYTREGIRELLEEIKDKLRWTEKEYVLDVGCGPGNVTAKEICDYLPKNSKIIGADISVEMIQYANRHHASDNLVFKLTDITEKGLTSFWNNEFTKVFSFFCLNRVGNQREAYENIYKILKPGGELIAIVVVDFDWNEVQQYLARNPKYADKKQASKDLPKEEFTQTTRKLLKDIGFVITFDKVKKKHHIFETVPEAYDLFENISYLPNIISNNVLIEAILDFKNGSKDLQILELTDEGIAFKYIIHCFVAKKPFIKTSGS